MGTFWSRWKNKRSRGGKSKGEGNQMSVPPRIRNGQEERKLPVPKRRKDPNAEDVEKQRT